MKVNHDEVHQFSFDFQLRLGLCLNRLAFYYAGIQMRGGDGELSAASASQKAIESCDEAIRVFAEVRNEREGHSEILFCHQFRLQKFLRTPSLLVSSLSLYSQRKGL